jgi:molybdopterin-guanine dinucleotide biosynthesis protein
MFSKAVFIMQKVIAVRGVSNSGKTTSIKKALEILKTEMGARVITVIHDGRDVIIVVEIDSIIIIIASAGILHKCL